MRASRYGIGCGGMKEGGGRNRMGADQSVRGGDGELGVSGFWAKKDKKKAAALDPLEELFDKELLDILLPAGTAILQDAVSCKRNSVRVRNIRMIRKASDTEGTGLCRRIETDGCKMYILFRAVFPLSCQRNEQGDHRHCDMDGICYLQEKNRTGRKLKGCCGEPGTYTQSEQ